MRIGIDLGGTKIEGIVLDDQGRELIRHRVSTPARDYSATLQAISDLIRFLENAVSQTATIGIGSPGAISPSSGLLRNSNSVCMNGQPVKEDLEKILGREIRLANDANCFALSEAVDGAGKGKQVVFGVIIGTGTGAGIIINGRVLNGVNAIAGEWGHNPLPWPLAQSYESPGYETPGPECYCGKRGCIETYLSGPGLSGAFYALTGERQAAIDIVELAEQGNEPAEICLQQYENRMARGLAHVINILDPDVIVLGGGMSNVSRLYTNVPKQWSNYVFSDKVSTALLAPVYGDSSGVRGAAWLWE